MCGAAVSSTARRPGRWWCPRRRPPEAVPFAGGGMEGVGLDEPAKCRASLPPGSSTRMGHARCLPDGPGRPVDPLHALAAPLKNAPVTWTVDREQSESFVLLKDESRGGARPEGINGDAASQRAAAIYLISVRGLECAPKIGKDRIDDSRRSAVAEDARSRRPGADLSPCRDYWALDRGRYVGHRSESKNRVPSAVIERRLPGTSPTSIARRRRAFWVLTLGQRRYPRARPYPSIGTPFSFAWESMRGPPCAKRRRVIVRAFCAERKRSSPDMRAPWPRGVRAIPSGLRASGITFRVPVGAHSGTPFGRGDHRADRRFRRARTTQQHRQNDALSRIPCLSSEGEGGWKLRQTLPASRRAASARLRRRHARHGRRTRPGRRACRRSNERSGRKRTIPTVRPPTSASRSGTAGSSGQPRPARVSR
jgi:hypothetical protein